MKKNFALLGCGRIGERHAEQIKRIGHLCAVCDIDPIKVDAFANKYGAKVYYHLDQLIISEKNIEVISICTPNGLHAVHAISALKAGINVLCEKPLCLTNAEGRTMINTANQAGKKIFVVKQNRYNPPVVYLKQLLQENLLGKIYSFQINCFWHRPPQYYTGWRGTKDLDGGTLFTQFSHFIDLLYWLLGDVETVKAIGANGAHPAISFEDTGAVLFHLTSGAIGTLHYTVNSFQKNMEGSITIFGEKGTVKIGGEYLNELEYFMVAGLTGPKLPTVNTPNQYGFYQGSMSNHDKVYDNLLKVLENPELPFASAEDGLKTVEIIQRIYSAF